MFSVALQNTFLKKINGVMLTFWEWSRQVFFQQSTPCFLLERVADDLVASFPIWTWQSSTELLVHIACWYTQLKSYHGFQLCSNTQGNTFLLHLTTGMYVKDATEKLLHFDAIEHAELFVDAWHTVMRETANGRSLARIVYA